MRIIRQLIVAAFALILAVEMASARSLTDDESRSLADTVAAFDAAMRDSDYETVGKTVPPKILGHIAKSAGIEIEALRKVMMDQMKSMLLTVKIGSFDMDLPKAEHRELSSGEAYVLIPTETVIEAADGSRTRSKSHTLALLDGGIWYLLRVNDPQQVEIMRQVYPDFVGVEFPQGSTEAVN
jgi:hypothetical protein